MLTDSFDFDLPERFIAQEPVSPRDSSNLMVFDSGQDLVSHRRFADVTEYLREGDVLVVNRSKVIPARILFSKDGRELEIFLLSNAVGGVVDAMVRPGKLFDEGAFFELPDGITCKVLKVNSDGTRQFKFSGDFMSLGVTPLPPYIHNLDVDPDDYQTVYAQEKGSVAAPTAGLHFTPDLLDRVRSMGVSVCEVVLHVGRGTFLPVKSSDIRDHEMHEEFFVIDEDACNVLNKTKESGGRIFAVGTTSVRVLESTFDGAFRPCSGSTDIFIYPGYEWKVVDALVTNFHLPKSTLLMLVSSFLESKGISAPVDRILELYEVAKGNDYRFYSFGDAMLLF